MRIFAYLFNCKGIGTRRIDITEEHCVFHAVTTYFDAGKTDSARRTASIGPGVSYYNPQDLEAHLDDDVDEPDWDDIRAHLPQTHERTLNTARSRSRSRHGLSSSNGDNTQPIHAAHADFHPQGLSSTSRSLSRLRSVFRGAPTMTTATVSPFPSSDRSHARRSSVDSSHFQRIPFYETNHEQDELTPISPYSSQLEQVVPIPPYSLLPVSPTSPPSSSLSPTAAAQSLEEFRNSLHSSLRNSQLYQSE